MDKKLSDIKKLETVKKQEEAKEIQASNIEKSLSLKIILATIALLLIITFVLAYVYLKLKFSDGWNLKFIDVIIISVISSLIYATITNLIILELIILLLIAIYILGIEMINSHIPLTIEISMVLLFILLLFILFLYYLKRVLTPITYEIIVKILIIFVSSLYFFNALSLEPIFKHPIIPLNLATRHSVKVRVEIKNTLESIKIKDFVINYGAYGCEYKDRYYDDRTNIPLASLHALQPPKQIDDNTYEFIIYEDAILNRADYDIIKGFERLIYPFLCENSKICNVCQWNIRYIDIYFEVGEGVNKTSFTIRENFNDLFDNTKAGFYLKSLYLHQDEVDAKKIYFSNEEQKENDEYNDDQISYDDLSPGLLKKLKEKYFIFNISIKEN